MLKLFVLLMLAALVMVEAMPSKEKAAEKPKDKGSDPVKQAKDAAENGKKTAEGLGKQAGDVVNKNKQTFTDIPAKYAKKTVDMCKNGADAILGFWG